MSIVLHQISKAYGAQVVVDRVSLEILDGELFVLLGASGSGKSTILRMIAGLTQPTGGSILLHGWNVTHLPPQQRDIGLVFQNYSIFRHMSVADNIEFGLRVRKIQRETRAQRRDELLELVGLSGLGNRFMDQLSGGQQQRVALARALAHQPKVLLLDEPFGALDVKIRRQLRRSLSEIQRKLGVTTVLVTHDQEEGFELADRIGVIEKGRLLEVGPSETLYQTPRSPFVSTFLGSGTVLMGRVRKGFARFGPLALSLPHRSGFEEGGRVQLLIRPEQISLSGRHPSGDRPVLGRGRIVEQSFAGAERRLRLLLPALPQTRQIAPAPDFGEEGLTVEAIVPARIPLRLQEPWVVLEEWHLMKPTTPHLLVISHDLEVSELLHSARFLTEQLDGWATILHVLPRRGGGEAFEFEKDSKALSQIDLRLRRGETAVEILAELEESRYELILFGTSAEALPGHTCNSLLKRLLRNTTIPVLLTKTGFTQISRILICTAAGEPGKEDVRTGGLLARRIGAEVTLLHVRPKRRSRAGLHLEQAGATLRSLEIEARVCNRIAGSPSEGILTEAREGQYDLIVVGRHSYRSRGHLVEDDVTQKVIFGAHCPVLIVSPETEGEFWYSASGMSSVSEASEAVWRVK